MTARSHPQGGARFAIRYAFRASAVGQLLVAATETGVCAILIGDDRDALVADLRRRFPQADIGAADASLSTVLDAVITAIEMPGETGALPLDIRGTAFQQRVWQALRAIPCGQTISYGELASRLGNPRAVRAIARACGANPIAVVVPCHRVVGSDGALTGYRWGIENKRRLLARESYATA